MCLAFEMSSNTVCTFGLFKIGAGDVLTDPPYAITGSSRNILHWMHLGITATKAKDRSGEATAGLR